MTTMSRELERGLVEAGIEQERAVQIAEAVEDRMSEMATREDLRREMEQLRREIGFLREEMRRLLYWILTLVGAMVVGGFSGLIVALAS